MANSDAPKGGQLYNRRDGANMTGGLKAYFVPSTDSTALFVGDPVTVQGSSNTDYVTVVGGTFEPGSLPTVARSGSTGQITGFVASVAPTSEDSLQYRAASTDRVVLVADDPNYVFEIQGDSATNSAAGDVGNNANVIFTASGSTSTGLSGAELDVSTIASTSSLQLKIVGFKNSPNNEIGTTHSKYLVTINNSSVAPNTAGV